MQNEIAIPDQQNSQDVPSVRRTHGMLLQETNNQHRSVTQSYHRTPEVMVWDINSRLREISVTHDVVHLKSCRFQPEDILNQHMADLNVSVIKTFCRDP